MNRTLKLNQVDDQFIKQIEQNSGQKLNNCYQCGKCTAGCPIAHSTEFPPHKIMRMLQLGIKEPVLASATIWLCLSCVTCTARCPKEVDLAHIMDSLRELAIKEGVTQARKQPIKLFEKLFLDAIKQHGKLYEMGTLARFNLLTLQPVKDLELLWPLLKKGKLKFTPESINDLEKLAQIFKSSQS